LLLDRADVLVSNLTPGATAKLGIAPDDVAARHPELIAVEIDGYGPGGPLSHKRAYDLLVQAESGACSITGLPGAPAKAGPPIADICSGLHAALSIMALLCERGRSSSTRGRAVAVSLFDTMTDLMGYALTYTQHSGIDQSPAGMGSPAVAPYGAYATADGQTVVLGTTNDREWQRFARDLLGRPDLADDERFRTNPGRVEHRALLDEQVAAWCAERDLAGVQQSADSAGIGNSRYNTPSEVVAHPHLAARDRWRPLDTPGGLIRALLPPPVISGYEAPMRPVPALGQHTEAVLAELGLGPTEIKALIEGETP
jgi:crotonobetainyl-CoA:carnitine CoA-transferase CaiB-like acyl-CoA transferase